jgi:hypothetical protein
LGCRCGVDYRQRAGIANCGKGIQPIINQSNYGIGRRHRNAHQPAQYIVIFNESDLNERADRTY